MNRIKWLKLNWWAMAMMAYKSALSMPLLDGNHSEATLMAFTNCRCWRWYAAFLMASEEEWMVVEGCETGVWRGKGMDNASGFESAKSGRSSSRMSKNLWLAVALVFKSNLIWCIVNQFVQWASRNDWLNWQPWKVRIWRATDVDYLCMSPRWISWKSFMIIVHPWDYLAHHPLHTWST